MMRCQIHVHRSDGIVGTHQVQLLVPSEVAKIEDLETPESDQHAEGLGVLAGVRFAFRAGGAEWIGLTGARKRSLQNLTISRQYLHVDVLEWNGIAGLCYDVLSVLEGLDIVRVVFLDHPRVLHIRAVIAERADLHTI